MDYSGKIIRKTPVVPSQTSASGVWSLDEALQAQRTDTWPVANVPDPISRSLRFRASATAYLNRTPSVAGNRKTWTFSAWIKRGTLGTNQSILHCYDGSSSRRSEIVFNSDNTIGWDQGGSSTSGLIDTVAVYRDPAAWYHLVCTADYSNGTAANRARIWVNGVLQTVTTSDDFDNADGIINSTNSHQIGVQGTSSNPFDGYMTEIQFIDGLALTPSSFGGTNAVTGVWEPRQYTGTYGTNGFYLPFSNITNTTTLGNDFSGNGNNWTTNNISLTAGSTYDSMLDVPTQWIGYNTGDAASVTRGNYCVLNPLVAGTTATITNGNLSATGSTTTFANARASFTLSSGKWYWEQTITGSSTLDIGIGLCTESSIRSSASNIRQTGWYNILNGAPGEISTSSNGGLYTIVSTTNWATNDVIMVAYDADTGYIWFGRNGTWYPPTTGGSAGNPAAGTNQAISAVSNLIPASWHYNTNAGTAVNFGQRPFAYTPPAGFRSLCTTNLPSPTILQGNRVMDVSIYTGNGTSQSITNSGGFQPDLVWMKRRSTAGSHVLVDAVRGANKLLYSNLTDAEDTNSNALTSFNSGGFSVGSDTNTNQNGTTLVGWQWNAGGTTVTNTAGSISAQVRANPTAGFSIVTWTGNATNNSSVGHGLGTAPAIVIIKNRTDATTWFVKGNPSLIPAFTSQDQYLYLNLTNNIGTSSFNQTTVTSSLIQFPVAGNDTNGSGKAMVAYCFAPVAGYSAFNSYTGNGSSDGPFIYTGFRPRYVLVKASSASGGWNVADSVRSPSNVADDVLFPNLSDAEGTFTWMDFTSNGFKIRNTLAGSNSSGVTYIYMAFAENPFKNALAR
jgi:hypothetical protein